MPVRCRDVALAALLSAIPLIGASAISVDVAKKCDALVAKQFPPRVPGNPAAGIAKGTAKDQRDFFQKCVNNGGNMDDGGQSKSK